jgi:Domain of unknown function (DUF4760)
MDVVTSILGFCTLFVLIWQVYELRNQISSHEKSVKRDHERRRKQATFEAMNVLRSDELDAFERAIRVKVTEHLDWKNVPDDLRNDVRSILSHFERFAVAVNTGVYDVEIVDRTMGAYLIGLWAGYDDYVIYVRKKVSDANKKYYCDLEDIVKTIKNRRTPETNPPPIDVHAAGSISN